MKKDKLLVFSHVPKTAGTSLKFLLRRYFGTRQMDAIYRKKAVVKATYFPEDLRKDIKMFPNLQLVAGHCIKPFVDFKEFEERMEWFTFMRNPIKRYISHYIHQQTEKAAIYNMDLIEWSQNFNRSNWTVRMYAGEENLDKAKEVLHQKFKFIGITEKFDESIDLMKIAFGLDGFDIKLPELKMIIKDTSIRDKIYDNYHKYEELILSENELDIQLYDYFMKNMWEVQKEKISKMKPPQAEKVVNHEYNLWTGKLHRNLIYKPFVKLQNFNK